MFPTPIIFYHGSYEGLACINPIILAPFLIGLVLFTIGAGVTVFMMLSSEVLEAFNKSITLRDKLWKYSMLPIFFGTLLSVAGLGYSIVVGLVYTLILHGNFFTV